MGAYKQFLASDIIITPLVVNKGFTFSGVDPNDPTSLHYPQVSIDRFVGTNILDTPFIPGSDPTTGQLYTQYQRLVYNSIKELYYSNYFNEEVYGSPINQRELVAGSTSEGDRYVGAVQTPAYENYLQSNLTFPRFFPTQSNVTIGVLSIPAKLFGDYILPTSLIIEADKKFYTDDGEGNVLDINGDIVGNIIYTHGIVIFTGNQATFTPPPPPNNNNQGSRYQYSFYLSQSLVPSTVYKYGITKQINWNNNLNTLMTTSDITVSFSSSYTIQECQFKCTLRENEFNFTLNPSTISGSYTIDSNSGKVYDFVTSSYFAPFITTVGLYDEQQNLLAIGKLSQPVPSSNTTDLTILINIDR